MYVYVYKYTLVYIGRMYSELELIKQLKMRMQVFLCLLASLLSYSPVIAASVSQEDEDSAVQRIFQLIEQLTTNQTIRNPAAKIVRLAFHDCMDGCDGCLNLNSADHNGLKVIYPIINNIYDTEGYNSTGMSRADFIALAGIAAVRQASSIQSCNRLGLPLGCTLPTPNITIKYGRIDCPTSPTINTTVKFPNPHGNLDHVLEVFQGSMNITVRQVVAILGAHTLGEASIRNTGFQGPWVPDTAVFDNMFYRQLIVPGWSQEQINDTNSPVFPDARHQWTLNRPGQSPPASLLMLNTDVALWKFIQPDSAGRETNTTCRTSLTDCPPSETANIVMEFAMNNTAFHEAFSTAYQILVENGYETDALTTAALPQPTSTIGTPTNTDDSGSGAGTVSIIPSILLTLAFMLLMVLQ